jgi:hypothetical protein
MKPITNNFFVLLNLTIVLYWVICVGAWGIPVISTFLIGAFVEIMNATEIEDPYMTI